MLLGYSTVIFAVLWVPSGFLDHLLGKGTSVAYLARIKYLGSEQMFFLPPAGSRCTN